MMMQPMKLNKSLKHFETERLRRVQHVHQADFGGTNLGELYTLFPVK